MPERLRYSNKKNNLGFISSEVRKYIGMFSLGIFLVIAPDFLAKKIDNQKEIVGQQIKSAKEIDPIKELKYFSIQQNFGLIKAILEKSKDENNIFEESKLKQYEKEILIQATDVLIQGRVNELHYTLTKKQLEKLSTISDSIAGLIDARYGKEQAKIIRDGTEKPNYKLILKFIKLTDGEYILSDIYIENLSNIHKNDRDSKNNSDFLTLK